MQKGRFGCRVAGAVLVLSFGCATDDIAEQYAEQQPAAAQAPAADAGPFPNWPLAPDRAEVVIPRAEASALATEGAGAGVTGALRVEIAFEGKRYPKAVKWKEFPRDSLDGVNNAPRKEIAAYELQKLFLDPEDYVVPTTYARCVPFDRYGRGDRPSVEGSACVLGAMSVWLRHVELPPVLFEPARFEEDETYAYYMANLNLFTVLFDHQDGRSGNFLVSSDPARRQVFSIDNGVAMNSWPWYNWFVPNWNKLRVPALRRDSVERLRALEREDLDPLLVVQQLALDEEGIYRDVAHDPPLEPDEGVTVRDGVIQLGLTRDEVDDIWERIQDLRAHVEDGEVALF